MAKLTATTETTAEGLGARMRALLAPEDCDYLFARDDKLARREADDHERPVKARTARWPDTPEAIKAAVAGVLTGFVRLEPSSATLTGEVHRQLQLERVRKLYGLQNCPSKVRIRAVLRKSGLVKPKRAAKQPPA